MALDTRKISEVAQRLRNADPPAYEQLLRLLDAYTYDVTVAVTNSPTDTILNAQGRAQQAIKFMQLMTEFPQQPQQATHQKPTP